MSLSTWTDEEYGRVARALLFPPSRRVTTLIGFAAATSQLGYALDAKLQQLSAEGKAYALELADRILAAVRAKHEAVTEGCAAPDVTRVGDIQKDAAMGQRLRAAEIAEMREELALHVDHYVNPRAGGMPSGGVNGTWSP